MFLNTEIKQKWLRILVHIPAGNTPKRLGLQNTELLSEI
jgi:hypothetical protein